MKILIDLTSLYFHLSGVERYALNTTLSMLDSHPEDEYILVFAEEIHPDFRRFTGRKSVTAVTVPCRNRLWFAQVRLARELFRLKADAYYFPSFPAPWFFLREGTVDVIHDLSDFECAEGKKKLKTLYCRIGIRLAARRASAILTVSEFSRERIMEILHVPGENVSVAYGAAPTAESGGVDWEKIRGKYSLPEKYLLTVCTMEPRKNLSLLLRAFRTYRNEDPDTGLVLCGRAGWNPEMTFGESRDMERITATGFVDDCDLPSVYRHACAFVFPSKYEGFGLPPLEAMAQGCPVISSDAASMPEILGNAAVFFESGNESSLLEALRTVRSMDGRAREELMEKGRLRTEAFSWKKSAEKTHEVLRSAAERTGRK